MSCLHPITLCAPDGTQVAVWPTPLGPVYKTLPLVQDYQGDPAALAVCGTDCQDASSQNGPPETRLIPNDPSVDNLPRWNALMEWWLDDPEIAGDLRICRGRYHASDDLVVPFQTEDRIIQHPKRIIGYGAQFDATINMRAMGISMSGLQVVGAPSHGFSFGLGQGAKHTDLLSANNGGYGYYYGSSDEGFANSQITNCTFDSVSAQGNALGGHHFDGTSSVNRSWLNSNLWLQPLVRNNTGPSWSFDIGTVPIASLSRASYNTIIGGNSEGNTDGAGNPVIPDFANTGGAPNGAWAIVGAHWAETDPVTGLSIMLGQQGVLLGGRAAGDVGNKDGALNLVWINSGTPGEGSLIAYANGIDLFA